MFKSFTFRVALDGKEDLQATLDSAERAGFKLRQVDDMGDRITSMDVDGNELNMGRFVLDWWKRGGEAGGLVINLREDVENHLSREYDLDPDYLAVLTDHGGDVMFDLKDIPKDKAEWFLEKVTCGDVDTAEEILELGTESGGKVVSKRDRQGRYNREILWKPFRSRYYNPPTEDGVSVNPAPEEFKRIKKTKQTFAQRVAELKEIYGDDFVNAVPGHAFNTGTAQRQNPYAAKISRQKSDAQMIAELEEALQMQEGQKQAGGDEKVTDLEEALELKPADTEAAGKE